MVSWRGGLHLGQHAGRVAWTLGSARRVGDVGHRVVLQRHLMSRVGQVVHAQQPGKRLRAVAQAERGQSAGVLRGGEHGTRADRRAQPLGLGRQLFGLGETAAQGGDLRLRGQRDAEHERLAGLAGEQGRFLGGGHRHRQVGNLRRRPRLGRKRAGQQLQPPLLAQAGQRRAGLGDRHVEGADEDPDAAQEPPGLGIQGRPGEQPGGSVDDEGAAVDRRGVAEDREQAGIGRVERQPLGHVDDPAPGFQARLGPEAAQGRTPQDPDGQVEVAVGGDGLGQVGQGSGVVGEVAEAVVERGRDPGQAGAVVARQLQLRALAEQPLDDLRPAELDGGIGRP